MLAHSLLGGCSSSLSLSCLSLLSMLIAAARARVWSSFRWCSESPLLAHPETVFSCLFGRSRFSADSLLASCGALAPFRLCSRSQPQSSPWDLTSEARASAPSPPGPRGWGGVRAEKPLGLVSAGRYQSSVREALRFSLCIPVAVLSSVALKLPHATQPPSPPVKGLPSVWKLFLLHSSLPEGQVPSLILLSLFFLFSFALPKYVGSFLPFGKSEVFCQRSVGVL